MLNSNTSTSVRAVGFSRPNICHRRDAAAFHASLFPAFSRTEVARGEARHGPSAAAAAAVCATCSTRVGRKAEHRAERRRSGDRALSQYNECKLSSGCYIDSGRRKQPDARAALSESATGVTRWRSPRWVSAASCDVARWGMHQTKSLYESW